MYSPPRSAAGPPAPPLTLLRRGPSRWFPETRVDPSVRTGFQSVGQGPSEGPTLAATSARGWLKRKRVATSHRPDAAGVDRPCVVPAALPDACAQETGGHTGLARQETRLRLLRAAGCGPPAFPEACFE